MELNHEIFWGVLIVIFALVECFTLALVSIWFVLGAIVAFILSLFSFSFLFQFASFAFVSTLSFILLRPLTKMIAPKNLPMNSEAILNEVGLAETSFDHIVPGRVFINGLSWRSLASSPDTKIPYGSQVVIDKIVGATLYVSIKEIQPNAQ